MGLVLCLAACVIYGTLAWFHLVPCCKKSCSGYGFYSTWGCFCVLLHVLFKQCVYGEGAISLEHEGHICADAMECLCHIQTNFCIKTSSSQSSHKSFSKRKNETKKIEVLSSWLIKETRTTLMLHIWYARLSGLSWRASRVVAWVGSWRDGKLRKKLSRKLRKRWRKQHEKLSPELSKKFSPELRNLLYFHIMFS